MCMCVGMEIVETYVVHVVCTIYTKYIACIKDRSKWIRKKKILWKKKKKKKKKILRDKKWRILLSLFDPRLLTTMSAIFVSTHILSIFCL